MGSCYKLEENFGITCDWAVENIRRKKILFFFMCLTVGKKIE